MEDTGLADWLPLGDGLLSFHDPAGALRCIEQLNSDYDRHCRAARRLAEDFFTAEKVLPALLDAAMN